jgi:hypothetical protein
MSSLPHVRLLSSLLCNRARLRRARSSHSSPQPTVVGWIPRRHWLDTQADECALFTRQLERKGKEDAGGGRSCEVLSVYLLYMNYYPYTLD